MTHLYALTDSNSLDARWFDTFDYDSPITEAFAEDLAWLNPNPEVKYIMEYKENKGGWKATGRVWAI